MPARWSAPSTHWPWHWHRLRAPPATEDSTADQPPPESDETADSPLPEADAYLAGLDKKLVELRIKRTVLLLKYTAPHPDEVQVARQLEQLRAARSRFLKRLQKN